MNPTLWIVKSALIATFIAASQMSAYAQPVAAIYYSNSGRIAVDVDDVIEWYIESFDHQLTGPDDVVLTGVLPTNQFSLVTNNDERVGESSFNSPYTYSLDLGRIAATNILPGRLVIRTTIRFSQVEMEFPVRYVPEGANGPNLCIGCLALILLRRQRRLSIATSAGLP